MVFDALTKIGSLATFLRFFILYYSVIYNLISSVIYNLISSVIYNPKFFMRSAPHVN
jgi:hypothetical protein